MISTSVKDNLQIGVENVKVYKENEKTERTPEDDEASLDKATRVAFLDATSYTDGDVVTYDTKGTEYAIAAPATTDYNLEELKALGYTGTSEYTNYDNGQTVLDNGTTNVHKVTSAKDAKTTSDGSFTYGSVDVYVWFDGTDKACTNAIFSQKVTFINVYTIKPYINIP